MLKREKGITLIALIITIIVMLILVGVTINVALNGGLFSKAEQATKETEEKAILEEMLAMMVIEDNGKFNPDTMIANMRTKHPEYEITYNKPNVIVKGKLGTYNYIVSETEIKIGEDNLQALKEELEGKELESVMNENGFLNSEIQIVSGEGNTGIVSYKGEKFLITIKESGDTVIIDSVDRYIDNLEVLKEELEGKLVTEVMDEDGFINEEITLEEEGDMTGIIAYKGERFVITIEGKEGNYRISSVEREVESDEPKPPVEEAKDKVYGPTYSTYIVFTSEGEIIGINREGISDHYAKYEVYEGNFTEFINVYTQYQEYTIEDGIKSSNKFVIGYKDLGGTTIDGTLVGTFYGGSENKIYLVGTDGYNKKLQQVVNPFTLNSSLTLEDVLPNE